MTKTAISQQPSYLRKWLAIAIIGIIWMGFNAQSVKAVDGAASFYLLGGKGSLAGFLPPPGVFVTSDNYFYSGSANVSASRPFPIGDLEVSGDIDADIFYEIITGLRVMPKPVLGGRLGVGVSVPIGWGDIRAGATASLGGAAISANVSDDNTAFGDPVLAALLGWDSGNWHWNIGGLLNIPIGQWDEGRLVNLGFSRWAFDVTVAITYFDPKRGFEVSVAPGFTFNGENIDTGYESGTEFHVEFAVMQHLSKQFAFGLNGYHYKQVTGDSNNGPVFGEFKGQVTALGPAIKYDFMLGKLPVSTKLKWLHEFNVEKRLEGDVGLLQIAIPLSVAGQ